MANDIFDEIESPDIFDEVEPIRDERGRRRVDLLGQQAAAMKESESADRALSFWDAAMRMVEPFTGRGMLNQPARAMAAIGGVRDTMEDPFTGPIVRFPRPEGTSALAGVGQLASDLATGLTDPNMLVALPAAASPAGLALFAGDVSRHIPEQVENAARVVGDIGSTPAEKVVAVGQPLASAGMAALMGKAAQGQLPRYISVEEQLKNPELFLTEEANRAAVNLAAPGTVRPTEIQVLGPSSVDVQAPKYTPPGTTVDIFNAGEVPFERMQRFGGTELPPVEILPQMGRLPEIEILSGDKLLKEREMASRLPGDSGTATWFMGGIHDAPKPAALVEAVKRAEDAGLKKSAEAVVDKVESIEPVSPKPESTETAWAHGFENRSPEGIAKLEAEFADVTQRLQAAIAEKKPTDALLKEKQLAREALSVAKGDTSNALANEWLAGRELDPVATLKAFKGTEGTKAAQDTGAKIVTREQLADLKKTHAEAEAAVKAKLDKAETAADIEAIADEQQRAGLLKEAIEGALGLGKDQKYDKAKLGNGNMEAALKEYQERMAGDTPIAMETIAPETVTKWTETVTKVTPEVTEVPLTKTEPGQSGQALGIKAANPLIDLATDTILSGDWWKKHFTAAGSLPKAVHDKWVASRGAISAETKGIDYAKRDLYAGLRETFGISRGSELVGGMKSVPTAVVQDMNRALTGEIPIASLPPKLQGPIQKMRDHIDRLSFDLIDKGLIDSDLAVKVGNNLGTYLTRSYRIFDDPKWVENIPASIRQNAENYLWNEMRRTNPAAPVEAARTKLRELLQDWSESGIDKQMRAGKLGSKDLSQFMKRGDVPPELREVMGEYKDPVINYARSITKIARYIGDQEFLNFVKNDGLGKYLFPEGQSAPGFEAQLAADSSSTMAPLNGLRTSPLLKDAFEAFQKGQVNDNWFLQKYFQVNALSKGAKTVGSWLTQARNLVGQPFFNLMSGDVGLSTPANYATAIKAIANDIGLKNDQAWRSYYQNLRERGIAHESARAQELRDALNDAGLKDTQISGIGETGYGTAARKVFLDAPARLYEISDEIGKIVGYESKKKLLREANPTWTPEQVEVAAAERVRNTYPTYSKVPNAIKQLRRQPLWGPFISFPYEVFRTSFHNMRYAMADAASGNPVLRAQAAKQAAGMLTVLGSGYALSQASKALHGVSGDKEKDIRRFAPRWDKNAQLIFTGTDDDGAVKYVNWSYQNPYSYLTDPFVAFATSDEKDLFDRSVKSFGEFLRPFTSEQMLAAVVMDVSRNKTQSGREIYNEQDDWDTKWQKAAAHVATAVEPGTTQRLRTKIIPAAMDSQPDYGRKLDLQTELTSELTGFKQQRLDFPQALKYKAREFSKQEQNAEHKFTGSVGRTGTVPNEELVDAYHEADQARFALWREMRLDAQAALRNGVSEKDVLESLIQNGVGRRDAGLILQGLYTPQPITRSAVQAAQRFNRELPMRELELYRDVRIGIPLK